MSLNPHVHMARERNDLIQRRELSEKFLKLRHNMSEKVDWFGNALSAIIVGKNQLKQFQHYLSKCGVFT